MDLVVALLLLVAITAFTVWIREQLATGRAQDASEKNDVGAASEDEEDLAVDDEEPPLPKLVMDDDNELELTHVSLPTLRATDDEEDEDEDFAPVSSSIIPILFDPEAKEDVPTEARAFFVVSAVGQTAKGRRKRNEDAYKVSEEEGLYVVADGVGGSAGGDVASKLAVDTITKTMSRERTVTAARYAEVPTRAAQLADAVVEANTRVFQRASREPRLSRMGTTAVCARFCPRKDRVYVAHVGDSRCYLYRDGKLHQLTHDHTIGALHGRPDVPAADHLVRALGVREHIAVDLIFGRPRPGDRYLLCTDGLPRALSEDEIASALASHDHPEDTTKHLIAAAADARDNVTAIVVRIDEASQDSAHQEGRDLAG